MQLPFTGIKYTEEIGESPAAVDLRTGILYINKSVFFQYPKEWRRFIILHEAGHLTLKTHSEFKADEYALHHFSRTGNSLKEAVLALAMVLDSSNDEHAKRIKKTLQKANWWDKEVYKKKFVEPNQRERAMSDYIQVNSTALASCMGCGDSDGAKQAMLNILFVADPAQQDKLLEKFATDLADMKLGRYDGRERNYMAYFFAYGNKACAERNKEKAAAKAELLHLKNYKGEQVVETAGSIAAGVANAIIPGSGALVQKIVSGGGKVINSIVGIFQKKKAAGKTDSQIYNDPEFLAAKEAAAKELEQMYEDSAIYQEKYAKYLGQFTQDDKTFSTMRKKAKIKKEVLPAAGTTKGDTFSYAGLSLNLSGLNVFKPVFGLGAGVDAPVLETHSSGSANTDTNTQEKSNEGVADPAAGGEAADETKDKADDSTDKKKMKPALIIGIVVAVIVVVGVVIYFATKKAKKAA